MSDHYHILGLERGATPQAVKAAYRRLVLKYHPDRNPDPGAAQQFVRIRRAYEALSHPQKQSQYRGHTYRRPSPAAKTTQTADHRKYGTRHKYGNPPPTKSAEKKLYEQYLKQYNIFTKNGMKLPRRIWRERFAELRRECLRNHRWLVALSAVMLFASIFIAFTEERKLFAFNALLISVLNAWSLMTDKAPRSLAEQKSKVKA